MGWQELVLMQLHILEYLTQLRRVKFDPDGVYIKKYVRELKDIL